MRKALLLLLLVIPFAHAVGIGMLNNQVPVAKRTTTLLTIYLSNPSSAAVTVDLTVEGDLAKYVTLAQPTVTLAGGAIVPVEAKVTFKSTIPWTGSAMIIATERDQQSRDQIGVKIKTAVPIRFDFNPKKAAKSDPIRVLQEPVQVPASNPGITIGDFTITSPTLRKAAFSTSMLLLIIISLLLGFDFQILRHRRKSTGDIQGILKR